MANSTPTVFLPGIGASILTSFLDSARAISLLRVVILFTLVPLAISNSYWATVGPTWTSTTLAKTPKLFNTFSNLDILPSIALLSSLALFLGLFNKSSGGNYRGKFTSGKGIACGYEYEFFAGAQNNVGRLHLKYASMKNIKENVLINALRVKK